MGAMGYGILEIEAMWQTMNGWQHIAWLDANPSTTEIDRSVCTTNLSQTSICTIWDGIADQTCDETDHPDIFDAPKKPMHRLMPRIASGTPVTPPFFHIFVRLKQSENDTDPLEIRFKIYVPQVYNIIGIETLSLLSSNISCRVSNNVTKVIYYGNAGSIIGDANQIVAYCMAIMPSRTNIKIVCESSNIVHSVKGIILSNNNKGLRLGNSDNCNIRNRNPYSGYIWLYMGSIGGSVENQIKYISELSYLPLSRNQLLYYVSYTIAHEIGHSVGLVDPEYFYAIEKGRQKYHNRKNKWEYIMNMGGLRMLESRINFPTGKFWFSKNADYIRFVLPTPIGDSN